MQKQNGYETDFFKAKRRIDVMTLHKKTWRIQLEEWRRPVIEAQKLLYERFCNQVGNEISHISGALRGPSKLRSKSARRRFALSRDKLTSLSSESSNSSLLPSQARTGEQLLPNGSTEERPLPNLRTGEQLQPFQVPRWTWGSARLSGSHWSAFVLKSSH